MKASILTIGDEILIGQIIDTNSAWIATELTKLGISIHEIRSISDSAEEITASLKDLQNTSALIIITGGLGPTKDDITKHTLTQYFNTSLVFNQEVYNNVEGFLSHRGVQMNKLNRDQALVPQKATILTNRQGTAPGMWFEQNKHVIVSLPGVPREMKGLMLQEVLPKVSSYFQLDIVLYRTAIIAEIPESHLALKIEDWENKLPENSKLAYLPSPGIVRLRLGISHKDHEEGYQLLDKELLKLMDIIPRNVVSLNEESLQVVVGKLLKNRNKTLVTAESCTGGNIARLITAVPGSSAYFKGSVVAYANEVKQNLLNVDGHSLDTYGAVSQQVVEQMAQGALEALQADYAIATSGIAGPDGGTDDKPIGMVWIAIAGPEKVFSKQFQFGTEREINILRASNSALNYLRKVLLGLY